MLEELLTDPSWLPSAVMQTVGALYSIFTGIFIISLQFTSQKLETFCITSNNKAQESFNKFALLIEKIKMEQIKITFFVMSGVVSITIIFNGIILYLFTIHKKLSIIILNDAIISSLLSLALSILIILLFSLLLVSDCMNKMDLLHLSKNKKV